MRLETEERLYFKEEGPYDHPVFFKEVCGVVSLEYDESTEVLFTKEEVAMTIAFLTKVVARMKDSIDD